MALTLIQAPAPLWQNAATSDRFSTQANAVGEGAGFVFQAPVTDTLTHFVFSTGTVTTGPTADGRVETVNASGLPSGTLYHASGAGTLAILDTNDNAVLELPINGGTGIPITRGDLVVCTITSPATPGDWNIAYGALTYAYMNYSFPYAVTNTGSWTKQGPLQPMFGIRCSTNGYTHIPGFLCPNTSVPGVSAFNSGSNPDEYGNRFIAPASMRCVGAEFWLNTGAGDYKVNLRSVAGTLLASSGTLEGDAFQSLSMRRALFATPYELVAGTEYDITLEAMTTTGVGGYWSFVTNANSTLGCSSSGVNTYRVTYNNGGSRDVSATTTVLSIAPLIDQVHDGAGGGGGLAANLIRGFVA